MVGDSYGLPSALTELVLREAGWHAESYGTGMSVQNFASAIRRIQPILLWVSVSDFEDRQKLIDGIERIRKSCDRHDAALVVTGSALTQDIRSRLSYSAYCQTLASVSFFADHLVPPLLAA
jgi:methanogenic corrinoid protein MtbC1